MRHVLNLLWLVLSGFWLLLVYMVVGALWWLTIIGIPFGIASCRALRALAVRAHGRDEAWRGGRPRKALWFLLSGVWLAVAHAAAGVLMCLIVIESHPDRPD